MASFASREDHQMGSKWLHRSVYCYFANCLVDPISVPFPAEQDSEGGVESDQLRTDPYVSDQFFEEFILDHLLRLSSDSIVNVRLCAARAIRNILRARPYFQDLSKKCKLTPVNQYTSFLSYNRIFPVGHLPNRKIYKGCL